MRRSSRKRLSAFDFKAEDALVEFASKQMTKKYQTLRNPKRQKSPLTKYAFLQYFDRECDVRKAVTYDMLCIDIDEKNDDDEHNNSGSCSVGTSKTVFQVQEDISDDLVASASTSNNEKKHIFQYESVHGNIIPECELKQENLVDVISDDEEGLEVKSPSDSQFHPVENEGDIQHQFSLSIDDNKIEKKSNNEAVVFPYFVFCASKVFTWWQLIFFSDHIKLEDLGECRHGGSSSLEWVTDDLIHIKCQQIGTGEPFFVKVRFRQTDMGGYKSGISGVVKSKFAGSNSHWQEKVQTIILLASKYKARWKTMLNPEIEREGSDSMGKRRSLFYKRPFADFDKSFEDIVYPEGDPDAVSLSKRDVELLQPGTFINDTIIDFYIKYLQNKIQPQKKHQFHFFNSFFFRKLIDLDKDQRTAFKRRAAFQRVLKWTQKVNIFEKDYIFIPVNFNLHWSLLVICHPGEVATFRDEEIEMVTKVPCILHLDSIKGSHSSLKNLVQRYLWEEWKERHKDSSETVLKKFLNLRFVPLELPQQENSSDCGLFLLHYVELFLEEAPVNFSPITKVSNFLSIHWFPPGEASHKRFIIQQLIHGLLDAHAQRIPYGNHLDNPKSPEGSPEKEYAVEHLAMHCSQPKEELGDSVCFTSRGIDSEFLVPSTPGGNQNDKETRAALEFFGQEAEASCCSKYCKPYDQNSPVKRFHPTMSPIQEEAESSRHLIYSESNEHKLPDEVRSRQCPTSYSFWDVMDLEIYASPEISMQTEHENEDSLSESSSCGSPDLPGTSANGYSVSSRSRYFMEHHEKEGRQPRSIMPTIHADDGCEIPISDASNSKELEDCVSYVSNSKNLDDCVSSKNLDGCVSVVNNGKNLEDSLVENSVEVKVDASPERKETGNSLSFPPENLPSSCQAGGPSEDSNLVGVEWVILIDEDLGNEECNSKCPPYRRHRCTRQCTHS